jgi:hypothetical protein
METGSRQETRQIKKLEPRFDSIETEKGSSVAAGITGITSGDDANGDDANGDDANDDDANDDDANAGDASADDSPNGDGGGASALRWSSPWCHPEPRRRRRDWPATGPGRVRRERSA